MQLRGLFSDGTAEDGLRVMKYKRGFYRKRPGFVRAPYG